MVKISVGTAGFSYQDWIGPFYPKKLKKSQHLEYFSRFFNLVEINSTFYHYPTEKQIHSWIEKSDNDFLFTFKAPRIITHRKRLIECKDPLLLFLHLIKPVKEAMKLGAILFQTPPSFPLNLEVLQGFLDDLPGDFRYAFEFRNRTFYDTRAYSLLSKKKVDFIYVSEQQGPPFEEVITGFKYFRMHGSGSRYASNYSKEELSDLAIKAEKAIQRGCSDVYVYFNNDYNAYAPYNAIQLTEILKGKKLR